VLTKGLYRIEYISNDKAIVKLSDENHPVFKAHFPNYPILPGFVNFDIVSEAFGLEITNIKKAKFLNPASPNQTLTYLRDKNSFKVICEDEEIANFTLG
jgi:3-hydroxyacyl-[acyl-carrier-protein] dehydratase